MIEGIIFDLDGTLINSLPIHYQCYKTVFIDIGIDLSHSDYFDNIGGKASEIIPKMIGNRKCSLPVAEIHQRKKELLDKMVDQIEIEPLETAKLLQVFHGKYKIALGSAGSRMFIEKVMKKFEWEKYFDAMITGEDVENGKPNPQVFLMAAEKMNVKPGNCIVFEDQKDGVEAAKRAGMMWFNVNKTIGEKPNQNLLSAVLHSSSLPKGNPDTWNGPDGYPLPGTNLAFEKAKDQVLNERQYDLEQAKRFMKRLRNNK